MAPTQIPGTPEKPTPQADPSRSQPGQGDDFTTPAKKDPQSLSAARPDSEPVEPQNPAQPNDDEDNEEISENDDESSNGLEL